MRTFQASSKKKRTNFPLDTTSMCVLTKAPLTRRWISLYSKTSVDILPILKETTRLRNGKEHWILWDFFSCSRAMSKWRWKIEYEYRLELVLWLARISLVSRVFCAAERGVAGNGTARHVQLLRTRGGGRAGGKLRAPKRLLQTILLLGDE